MRIGIACGGTGGHIFPGLAVAQVLSNRRHDVALWLSGRDIESVSTADWKGVVISAGGKGLPAGLSLRSITALFSLMASVCRCFLKMRSSRPDVLLAMGGYGSVGPVLAAHLLKVPIVLHEANVIPGRAIELLSRYASAVAISFEETRRYFLSRKTVFTGFPLRQDISTGDSEGIINKRFFTVLVMGGSQGAHRLNEVASSSLCRLHQQGIPVQVIHLSGSKDESMVRNVYESCGVPAVVFSFLKEMSRAYCQADIAITRAGAATCAEIVMRAVPSILVPLPTAMRDHQTANAQAIRKSGGVVVLPEKDMTPESLSDFIRECYRNPERLDKMRECLKNMTSNNAADKIADLVQSTAGN